MAEATASEVQSPALQTEHCDDVGPYWNARQFSVTTSRKSTEYERGRREPRHLGVRRRVHARDLLPPQPARVVLRDVAGGALAAAVGRRHHVVGGARRARVRVGSARRRRRRARQADLRRQQRAERVALDEHLAGGARAVARRGVEAERVLGRLGEPPVVVGGGRRRGRWRRRRGPPWHGGHCVPSRVGARPADAHAVHDHAAAVDVLSTAGVYVSTPAVHSHESPSSLGVWPVGHCRQLSDEMSRYLSAAGQVGMGTESDWAETSGRSARIAANRHMFAAGVRFWPIVDRDRSSRSSRRSGRRISMPTTRAARRAARCLTEVLPADALGLVLYRLPLAHDIARAAPTCHVVSDAARSRSRCGRSPARS